MRRNIFAKEIIKLQQGCIFTGAIADGIDHPVHGLIITPRCDIENCKVFNVNYLPITTLTEWASSDLLDMYRSKVAPNQRKELSNRLNNFNKNLNLDPQYRLSQEQLDKVLPEKDQRKLKKSLLDYWDLFDNDKCALSVKRWGNYKNKLDDLAKGKLERYLLLESWDEDNNNDFFVIYLTQIRHISFSSAQQLIDGLSPKLVNTDVDDLFASDSPISKKYKVVTQLTSPYIEYVCQKFSNAFFRIGIEDWPHDNIAEAMKLKL